MHDQHGAFDEGQQLFHAITKERLVAQKLRGEAVHLVGALGHLTLRVQMAMPGAARRDGVDQFDTADLDNAMALARLETRGLRIENNLAQPFTLPA